MATSCKPVRQRLIFHFTNQWVMSQRVATWFNLTMGIQCKVCTPLLLSHCYAHFHLKITMWPVFFFSFLVQGLNVNSTLVCFLANLKVTLGLFETVKCDPSRLRSCLSANSCWDGHQHNQQPRQEMRCGEKRDGCKNRWKHVSVS